MAYSKIVAGGAAAGANPVGIACGPDPDGVGIDCVSGVLARTYVGVPGRPASLPRPKLLDHRALSRDLRGRPPTGVLNRFGGGVPKYAANPGLTANFRRSLPEIGCLSQGLPHGKRCAWPCPPKTCKPPANCAQPGGRRLDVKLTACPHSSCGQESGSSVPEFNNLTAACPATTWRMPAATCPPPPRSPATRPALSSIFTRSPTTPATSPAPSPRHATSPAA